MGRDVYFLKAWQVCRDHVTTFNMDEWRIRGLYPPEHLARLLAIQHEGKRLTSSAR